ncbi:MAG: GNAT family N-acetyltransferase [SAR324 cluster bacterium]|nr:GNAT family N-acetyltransferase [SAR324 cluster bacterium]MCZ6730277.1 GNAT family N-acetyltransferase [SAR324 cluster bacterium]MCZ6844169.1 GNAT family N-acetyltransferase [SAR324 cluster bacterium]
MEIRKADQRDRRAWLRIRRTMWPQGSAKAHEREIAAGMAGEQGRLFLAVREGRAYIAMLECRVHQGARQEAEEEGSRRLVEIEKWYIAPNYRSQGVGAELHNMLGQWLAENDQGSLLSHAGLLSGAPSKGDFSQLYDDSLRLFSHRRLPLEE